MGLITGKVTNNKTGEPIWNAEVFLSDDKGNITNPPVGSVTDFDGNYSIHANQYRQSINLTVKHVSYKSFTKGFGLSQDNGEAFELDYSLSPNSYLLPEVEIFGEVVVAAIKKNPIVSGSILTASFIASVIIIKSK